MFNVNGMYVEFVHQKVLNPFFAEVGFVPSVGVSHATGCGIFVDEYDGYLNVDEDFDYDTQMVSNGVAFCSVEDNFNKAIGRKIALTRALEGSKFSKEERTAIWETYFDIVKKA